MNYLLKNLLKLSYTWLMRTKTKLQNIGMSALVSLYGNPNNIGGGIASLVVSLIPRLSTTLTSKTTDIVNVNSDNYVEALARRDEIEDLLNKAYGVAHHLQDMYNKLDDNIQTYEDEQAALDE